MYILIILLIIHIIFITRNCPLSSITLNNNLVSLLVVINTVKKKVAVFARNISLAHNASQAKVSILYYNEKQLK